MNSHFPVPQEELVSRYKRTQELLKENGVDGLLILQNMDLFYYTNSIQTYAAYLPVEGEILVFYKKAREKIQQDCPLELYPVRSYKDIPVVITEKGYPLPKKLGLEYDVVPVKVYQRVMKSFPGVIDTDESDSIKKTRMIKSEFELDILREAGKMNQEVFSILPQILKPGITESEAAREIEYLFRKKSHLGPTRMRAFNHELFFGHVLSGTHALTKTTFNSPLGGNGLHPAFGYGASQKVIEKNETVVVDYVSNYNGYHVDTTRTCAIGKISSVLEKHFINLEQIFSYTISLIRPGINCKEVYQRVIEYVKEHELEAHFMGYAGEHVGFIGHGIGIEIDEYPVIAPRFDMVIEKNMVMAFEPKLFFPGEGVVGLEDTFIVTETGCESVTGLGTGLIRIDY